MNSSYKAPALFPHEEASFGHYSDEELLRHLQFSANPIVAEMVKRFEAMIDRQQEERMEWMAERREWAIGYVSEYAGEDFHADVIASLNSALALNKPEMKQAIKTVIEELEGVDLGASRLIEAIRDGSAD